MHVCVCVRVHECMCAQTGGGGAFFLFRSTSGAEGESYCTTTVYGTLSPTAVCGFRFGIVKVRMRACHLGNRNDRIHAANASAGDFPNVTPSHHLQHMRPLGR